MSVFPEDEVRLGAGMLMTERPGWSARPVALGEEEVVGLWYSVLPREDRLYVPHEESVEEAVHEHHADTARQGEAVVQQGALLERTIVIVNPLELLPSHQR